MSVQYTQTTGTGTTWKAKECHTGNLLAFTTHDGIEVYAGGSSRSGGWWLMEKVPDLAMGPDYEVLKGLPSKNGTRGLDAEKWPCMEKVEITKPPKHILAIDFPDFKTPVDLGREFWLELVENIRANEVKTIHCMCMGGHGRTGVQLAILRYLLANEKEREEWEDAGEVIKAIRGPYCDKAVESIAQQKYVGEMCGIDVGTDVGFHKAQYGTTTTYGKSSVAKTNFNTHLVECAVCNFTTWEDKSHDLEKDDWCYDLSCQGKMIDVNEFCIERLKAGIEKDACMCLNCLQPISDIQAMSVTHLSENTMTMLHGEEWSKLLASQMALNGVGTLKGRLLKNLIKIMSEPEMLTDLIVVDSCILCNFNMKDNSKAPDYEKGDKGYVHHVKCDYCYKSVSPHILTMAIDTKNNTQNKACAECITKSSTHFFFSDKLVEEDGATIDGVSPQRWLRLTHINMFVGANDNEIDDEEDAEADTVADEEGPSNDKGGELDDRYI